MTIVKLQGGLGNQMFQYAIARSLSVWYGTDFALDHSFLETRIPDATHVIRHYDLDVFTLDAPRATAKQLAPFFKSPGKRLLPFPKRYHCITEPHYHFYPAVFEQSGHLYLDGYWQSERYFAPVADMLRQDFRFRTPVQPESQPLLSHIKSTPSVCLNVRRTDFVTNTFHVLCSMRYYHEAMNMVSNKVPGAQFFVFSDDVEWCREQFGNMPNMVIAGHEHSGHKFANYLQLMAACAHFIIPNSSFAWWAVWLANRPDAVVVAPNRWFNYPHWDVRDLMPASWIKISPD